MEPVNFDFVKYVVIPGLSMILGWAGGALAASWRIGKQFGEFQVWQKNVDSDISAIKEDVKAMKADMNDDRLHQTELVGDIRVLRTEIKSLSEGQLRQEILLREISNDLKKK